MRHTCTPLDFIENMAKERLRYGTICAEQGEVLRSDPSKFDEHKCNQVQAFAYDEDIHQLASFKKSDAFIEFLGVPQNLLQSEPPRSAAHSLFTFDNFVQATNFVANQESV